MSNHQTSVDSLVRRINEAENKPQPNGHRATAANIEDQRVVNALLAEKDGKWAPLYNGDRSGYPSPSEADKAFFTKLMFYTSGNVDQAERIARESGLVRPEWDERRAGTSKLRYELDRALQDWSGEGFTGGGEPPQPSPSAASWPKLDETALYGPVGEIVRAVEPHTEADPVALLANYLTAVGNVVGPLAFVQVGADKHALKLNIGLVGETAKGRKGMSWGPVRASMELVDPPWIDNCTPSGMSSGEGLVHMVRYSVTSVDKDGNEKVLDQGVDDKRLLVIEAELSRTLKVMSRDGNTLSPIVRQAWDGDRLQNMTKNSPAKSTGAHVSIIGHISRDELLRHLSDTEAAGGFANRFLWLMVRRSKELPFGGDFMDLESEKLTKPLEEALAFARKGVEIRWGESAKPLWREVYGPLSGGKHGLFGAVVGRGEAQTLRLAAIYASLDSSQTIEEDHLLAALALWQYAEDSARYIFGDATGDPTKDQIVAALQGAGETGLTRSEISDLFGRHKTGTHIATALTELKAVGKATETCEETGGRPKERWFAQ